jgi:regulation of enolase protein 1 (concanavalin A-like superfamily)
MSNKFMPVITVAVLAQFLVPQICLPTEQAPPGWGDVIDPSHDCEFTIGSGTLALGIPGTDHALAIEQGRTNAPRVLREVAGDFTAQVKLSAKFAADPASLISSRRAFQSAGLLLWQDSGTYIRFESAHMMVEDRTYDFASFELRREGRFEISGNAATHPLSGGARYLRLERRGSKIAVAESPDGTNWNSVGTMKVELPEKVLIGVTAGNNTSSPLTAEFSDFVVSPITASASQEPDK